MFFLCECWSFFLLLVRFQWNDALRLWIFAFSLSDLKSFSYAILTIHKRLRILCSSCCCWLLLECATYRISLPCVKYTWFLVLLTALPCYFPLQMNLFRKQNKMKFHFIFCSSSRANYFVFFIYAPYYHATAHQLQYPGLSETTFDIVDYSVCLCLYSFSSRTWRMCAVKRKWWY